MFPSSPLLFSLSPSVVRISQGDVELTGTHRADHKSQPKTKERRKRLAGSTKSMNSVSRSFVFTWCDDFSLFLRNPGWMGLLPFVFPVCCGSLGLPFTFARIRHSTATQLNQHNRHKHHTRTHIDTLTMSLFSTPISSAGAILYLAHSGEVEESVKSSLPHEAKLTFLQDHTG